MTTSFECSAEVSAPVAVAYGRWLEWVAEPGSEIIQERPHEFVAWRAPSVPPRTGTATFHAVDDSTTRLDLRVVVEPHGVYEEVLASAGLTTPDTDLEGFKEFVEHHHDAIQPHPSHRTPTAPTRLPGIGRIMGKP
ncbi:hypothetical protein [Saccharothrix hoggarensis]|uniref:Polyketide cyclase/dehydrase/lipid transport protein n=1 Tax=Saccharothrix hoggarensis TaxID=913853 RepID=A0ABW3QII4_9PSEU